MSEISDESENNHKQSDEVSGSNSGTGESNQGQAVESGAAATLNSDVDSHLRVDEGLRDKDAIAEAKEKQDQAKDIASTKIDADLSSCMDECTGEEINTSDKKKAECQLEENNSASIKSGANSHLTKDELTDDAATTIKVKKNQDDFEGRIESTSKSKMSSQPHVDSYIDDDDYNDNYVRTNARENINATLYPHGAVDISESNFKNSVISAGVVNYNNLSSDNDPTYKVTIEQKPALSTYGTHLSKAKQMLLINRIVFLQVNSYFDREDPLQALKFELATEFSLRTSPINSFDFSYFFRTKNIYKKPSVTYLDLFHAPKDIKPLLQLEFINEVKNKLVEQNNHLILVVGKEAFIDTFPLKTKLGIYRWEVKVPLSKHETEPGLIPDNHHAKSLSLLCSFFPGLDAMEVDSIMRSILEISNKKNDDATGNTIEQKKKKKKKLKITPNWETDADVVACGSGISYLDRDNEGVGYYFVELDREEQVRKCLIKDYPQYVNKQAKVLLAYYFSADRISQKFFGHLLELLIFLELRRSSILQVPVLLSRFKQLVVISDNARILKRFYRLIKQLNKHPATSVAVDSFLTALVPHIENDLESWDQALSEGQMSDSPTLEEVKFRLGENEELLRYYIVLIQQLTATYTLLIAGTDWRNGHNVEFIHRLTLFKQHKKNSNAHYICQGVGLLSLFEHLLSDWQNIEYYGKYVLERHKDKRYPRADLMLDAFNVAIRQIFNNCVFDDEWNSATGIIEQFYNTQSSLAETMAEVTIAKTPYKPSIRAINLAFTEEGATMTIRKDAPKKDMREIAHFYEQLTRALVRYTDEVAEFDGDRKIFLRASIRLVTAPLMNHLKSEQRKELREALRWIQQNHKNYRKRNPEIKRGAKNYDMQVLIADSIRMLLGNLRVSSSKELQA